MSVVVEQQEAVNRCLNACTSAVRSLAKEVEQLKALADDLQQRVSTVSTFHVGARDRGRGR